MPFIQLKTNRKVSKEDEVQLKSFFGRDISLLPGKSENWLMVEIEDGRKLYFKGNDEPCAILEVKVYHSGGILPYDGLTEKLTQDVSHVLHIPMERIYVEYEETPFWGWNGSDF